MSTTVSVILCSHNRAEHLEKTLQSLRGVEVPKDWTAELLLVDNASTDATPEVMRAFDHPEMLVRVMREEKKGKANAVNCGIDRAQGRVFLFTDDDVRFPAGWIQGMAQPILDGPADAVAGGVELAREVQEDWMTARHREFLASTERIDPEQPEHMVGANMAIGEHVFDTIPRLDTELGPGRLGLGEETLLFYQIEAAEFQIETVFDVTVTHHPNQSRLTHEGWKRAAEKSGRAGAYLSYHWQHRQYTAPALYAGWIYYSIILWLRQTISTFWGGGTGGMPLREFHLRRKLSRVKQHIKESDREPKYK
jgi:glycosyltransferase involved in cell wall biosynthesis